VYGFIAHELQEVVPYLVIGQKDAVDDQGKPIYQMVDYSTLTPILTKAIQEQQAVIEQQQQTINDLQSRMERLERAVQALQEQK
jgi:prefoldin subunit 5